VFRAADRQGKLFGSYTRMVDWVGKKSFYAYLGREGRRIFDDELFRKWYCQDNGRPCVPPSALAIATVLQMYDKCSDEEAINRCLYDDRWKVALDLDEQEKPFVKSTFQEFRANLLLHEEFEKLFLRLSLTEATLNGLIKGTKITAVLDTTPILGRGAVKDTYNLIAEGIQILSRALCKATKENLTNFVLRLQLTRYFSEVVSVKGSAEIDWTDSAQRRVFLNTLVSDAQRLLLESTTTCKSLKEPKLATVLQAEELLRKLVGQDVEPDPARDGQVQIKKGTARDRVPAAHDPDVRHGRKSASKRFDGHKLAIAAEPESRLVVSLEVLSGNAPDNEGALQLVEEAEANTGIPVGHTIGDCAYGDGATRQRFTDGTRQLTAKVPAPPSDQPYHKAHFHIDLTNGTVTCPQGVTTSEFKWESSDDGTRVKRFFFAPTVCQACPARSECLRTKDKTGGRTVGLHPQESLLQQAREYQKTPQFRADLKTRQAVEHVLARMIHIGGRQARYMSKAKTRIQMVLAATVLNLLIVLGSINDAQALASTQSTAASSQEQPAGKWSATPPGDGTPSTATQQMADTSEHNQTHTRSEGTRGSPAPGQGPPRGDPTCKVSPALLSPSTT
jgi:hypothetical protein